MIYAGHNLLIAHAHAVDVYRKEFQEQQRGIIGTTLSADWRLPAPTEDAAQLAANAEAATRSIAFHLGWFADPIYFGDYPQIMKDRVGDRLPTFTEKQKQLLKGSSDFFGLNNYGSAYAAPSKDAAAGVAPPNDKSGSFFADEGTETVNDPSWVQTAAPWNFVTPWGMHDLLAHIHKTYKPKHGIFITENGSAWPEATKEQAQEDTKRVDFLQQYLGAVHQAIDEGADVRGYFAWSLFDNYEWAAGRSIRFGLIYVDPETLERVPKKSSRWYGDLIAKNGFSPDAPAAPVAP